MVREGDRADGRLLSEPQAVLDAVREFGVRMNKVRPAAEDIGIWLLKAAGLDVQPETAGLAEGAAPGDDWVMEALSEEIFAGVVQGQRRDKALGADGWGGILLKWAPLWMQHQDLQALREVARSHDFPADWFVSLIKMIPKKDRDPSVFSKNRDISG